MKVRGRLALVVLAVVAALVLLSAKPRTTIFTCTTYFDFEKQDKWSAFCKAMDSILSQHNSATLGKINKWLVVNEYSANPKRDWKSAVKQRYPFVEIIQKGPSDKGQAASMNILLRRIRGYNYWIHWEETWYCKAPCLDRLLDIVETTNLSQIQCTQHKDAPNWLDSDAHPRVLLKTPGGTEYYRIYPSAGTEKYLKKDIS